MRSPTGQKPGLPDALATVLHGAGRKPGYAERLSLFGRFIGAWDVESHGTGHDGRPAPRAGEVRFGWVLGGSAVQDVWKAPGQPPVMLRPSHGPTLRTQDVIDELRGASSGNGR
jgi:hypothetical protein